MFNQIAIKRVIELASIDVDAIIAKGVELVGVDGAHSFAVGALTQQFREIVTATRLIVTETTHVAEMAKFIASELGEELGSDVGSHQLGDNGDDDVGYELKNADGILCDIGITKIDGTWSVFIENGDQNREVTSIDDIVDYLEGR